MAGANDIIMHKAYFDPIFCTSGSTIGTTTVPSSGTDSWTASGLVNGTSWNMSVTWTSTQAYCKAWSEVKIDVTGLVAEGLVEVPMGTIAQRTELPSIVHRQPECFYREFVVWSTQPLTDNDVDALLMTSSPTMPHMWKNELYPSSMTTPMVFGGRAELYSGDSTIDTQAGFLRQLFNNSFGMGDPVSTPILYCTRLFYGYWTPVAGGMSAQNFLIDIPASWELSNMLLVEPDEIAQLTTMRRSLSSPERRTSP